MEKFKKLFQAWLQSTGNFKTEKKRLQLRSWIMSVIKQIMTLFLAWTVFGCLAMICVWTDAWWWTPHMLITFRKPAWLKWIKITFYETQCAKLVGFRGMTHWQMNLTLDSPCQGHRSSWLKLFFLTTVLSAVQQLTTQTAYEAFITIATYTHHDRASLYLVRTKWQLKMFQRGNLLCMCLYLDESTLAPNSSFLPTVQPCHHIWDYNINNQWKCLIIFPPGWRYDSNSVSQ